MRKIIVLMSVLTVLFAFSACSQDDTITGEKFVKTSEKMNFSVSDIKEHSGEKALKSYRTEVKKECNVEFTEYENIDIAMSSFDSCKESFTEFEQTPEENKYADSDSKYEVTSEGYYMYVSRKVNTLVYVFTDADNKKAATEFINEIGY